MNTHTQRPTDKATQAPDSSYRITDWDAYSEPFLSVMPSKMLALNQAIASACHGHVADFGCGAGKIIPFVLGNDAVDNYTGVDASFEMIRRARWVLERLGENRGTTIHSLIESVNLPLVDTAISINSYYVWSDTAKVLTHIRNQLHPASQFFLATLNPNINMLRLLDEAELELLAHPHWQAFKEHNLGICASPDTRFVTLDALIAEARQAGFQVEDAHTRFYDGGLNFLQLAIA